MVEENGPQGNGAPAPPALLDAPGMTLQRVAAFAEAACLFHRAAPWRHLSTQDLLRIEGEDVPADFRHAILMSRPFPDFGLFLFEKAELHTAFLTGERLETMVEETPWATVVFGPIDELSPRDADLFLQHKLPVAGAKAYPRADRYAPGEGGRSFGPAYLSRVEAILRALAATEEKEIDTGRWARTVPTPDGAVEITFALPGLEEPPDSPACRAVGDADQRLLERTFLEFGRSVTLIAPKSQEEVMQILHEGFVGRNPSEISSAASTPAERAQEICYQACFFRGRRRVQMARQALAIDPDCAEAFVLQAEQTGDPSMALWLYQEGVAAGERSLGPDRFESDEPFLRDLKTGPYMRALLGLAKTCEETGRVDEAVLQYERLLVLNPHDDQMIRYRLVALLLRVGDDEALGRLLERFKEDPGATLPFAAALREFRRRGDTAAARKLLRHATELNPLIPDLLLGQGPEPGTRPSSVSGRALVEAQNCTTFLGSAWEAIPGALEWLKKHAGKPRLGPELPRSG